jgi:hypothetical protein
MGVEVAAVATRRRARPGAGAGAAGPPPVRVYRGGRLAAALAGPPPGVGASAARLLDARGRHTHTVWRAASPLVRHLAFQSTAGAPARGRRRSGVVARCRRPWLPPSALWPFSPRSYDHDVGGWVVEWAGHELEGAGGTSWLHPHVLVLVAAFDSLDHERAGRRPDGLFARLRAGGGGGGGGGLCALLRAAARFHRGGGDAAGA